MTTITIRCPDCTGTNLPMPTLQAPEGYVFDATLVLITCRDCGRMNSLADCTEVTDG